MQHHPVEFVGHPGHPPPPIGAPVPPMLGAAGASVLPPSIPTPLVVASLGKRHRFHRISFDIYVKIGCKVELVSKELNHFGVIAGLFRQIGGHSSRFVLFCSF